MIVKAVLIILFSTVIGYVTNYIAIRMLFRPWKAYHIGQFRIPFTPGLIPKEKERLAQSIGDSVTYLMRPSQLRTHLTKPGILVQIHEAVDKMFDEYPILNLLPDRIRLMIFYRFMILVLERIPDLVNRLDVPGIVSNSVREFSNQELEDMIVSITNRELQGITWFGAVLGCLIGIVQVLIIGVM